MAFEEICCIAFGSKSLCFVSFSPACTASTLHAVIIRRPNLAHDHYHLEGFDASSPPASVAGVSWLKMSLVSYNPFLLVLLCFCWQEFSDANLDDEMREEWTQVSMLHLRSCS